MTDRECVHGSIESLCSTCKTSSDVGGERMSRANEQAFPVPAVSFGPSGDVGYPTSGMSIREYFAAMAMQGFCAASATGLFSDWKKLGAKSADALLTKMSVDIADALIAELAK
jgi:hypothetical protein